jgi:hypothetical protein
MFTANVCDEVRGNVFAIFSTPADLHRMADEHSHSSIIAA